MLISIDGIDYEFSSRLPKNAEKSAQFVLARLLLGSVKISRAGRTLRQTDDFSTWPNAPQVKTGTRAFSTYLTSHGLGRSQSSFIRATTSDNRRLFQDVLAEFSNYFVETNRGSHTAGFVYLYRALERLSFSVPLLYCSTSSDFVGTFDDLKDLFKESGTGELGLLNKFIRQGKLIDSVVLDTTSTIDFSISPLNGIRFYNVVTSRYGKFHSTDPTRLQVEIKYRSVLDLFILLRNRYFHFRTGDGKANISNRDLHDSDEFFAVMNQVFCNFLGVLTLHTIARKYMA